MLIQQHTCFSATMHNHPIRTFDWSSHTMQLKMWLFDLDKNPPPMTLMPPNCQVHRQRYKVMSVTIAGTPGLSVSLCSLGCKWEWELLRQSYGGTENQKGIWAKDNREEVKWERDFTTHFYLFICGLQENFPIP